MFIDTDRLELVFNNLEPFLCFLFIIFYFKLDIFNIDKRIKIFLFILENLQIQNNIEFFFNQIYDYGVNLALGKSKLF